MSIVKFSILMAVASLEKIFLFHLYLSRRLLCSLHFVSVWSFVRCSSRVAHKPLVASELCDFVALSYQPASVSNITLLTSLLGTSADADISIKRQTLQCSSLPVVVVAILAALNGNTNISIARCM